MNINKEKNVFSYDYLQGPVNQIPYDEQHHSILERRKENIKKHSSLSSLIF